VIFSQASETGFLGRRERREFAALPTLHLSTAQSAGVCRVHAAHLAPGVGAPGAFSWGRLESSHGVGNIDVGVRPVVIVAAPLFVCQALTLCVVFAFDGINLLAVFVAVDVDGGHVSLLGFGPHRAVHGFKCNTTKQKMQGLFCNTRKDSARLLSNTTNEPPAVGSITELG